MDKSIIIIGAGIAGLSTGCYGQMNDYDTRIFELHDKPGGLCTSWKRKDYIIDGCIHWLVGTKPGSSFNRIWRELGALQGKEIVNHEEFIRFEGEGGKTFILYTDVDRLERHMKELAPADAEPIEEFTGAIRLFSRMDMPLEKPREISGFLDGIKMISRMLPFMRPFIKWSKISFKSFAARFSDPFLREVFLNIADYPDFPVLYQIMTQAWLHNRDAGYPVGSSLELSRSIERRYLDLGGEVSYKSRVGKILVEKGKAVGVRLVDGSEQRADIIISAADGHATIFEMLEGKYVNDKIRSHYQTAPVFQPLFQVALGVSVDLSGEPHSISFPLVRPIEIGGEELKRIHAVNYCFDPTLAPTGKSVLITFFSTEYPYWERLYEDRERYKAEKEHIAGAVVSEFESRFPDIKGRIEVMDVATPITYYRYTNNWKGSYQGWLLTTESTLKSMNKSISRTLPGLEGFYMAGQWIKPSGGGLPPAAMSGREVIQIIRHQDKRPFVTSEP